MTQSLKKAKKSAISFASNPKPFKTEDIKPNDAVQVHVLLDNVFSESLTLRVKSASPTKIVGKISDVIFFQKYHGIGNGDLLEISSKLAFHHRTKLSWMTGKFYSNGQ